MYDSCSLEKFPLFWDVQNKIISLGPLLLFRSSWIIVKLHCLDKVLASEPYQNHLLFLTQLAAFPPPFCVHSGWEKPDTTFPSLLRTTSLLLYGLLRQ